MMADSPDLCKDWYQRSLRYSLLDCQPKIGAMRLTRAAQPKCGGWLVSYSTLALGCSLVELCGGHWYKTYFWLTHVSKYSPLAALDASSSVRAR